MWTLLERPHTVLAIPQRRRSLHSTAWSIDRPMALWSVLERRASLARICSLTHSCTEVTARWQHTTESHSSHQRCGMLLSCRDFNSFSFFLLRILTTSRFVLRPLSQPCGVWEQCRSGATLYDESVNYMCIGVYRLTLTGSTDIIIRACKVGSFSDSSKKNAKTKRRNRRHVRRH